MSRVESNLFVMLLLVPIFFLLAGTYGLTTLRMDNGEKYELPKQIIQSQRSHALVDYKKYCDETGFQSLGKTYMSKLKVKFNYCFNYSTIVRKRSKKAFHYQCFPENLGKWFVRVGSSNLVFMLINY